MKSALITLALLFVALTAGAQTLDMNLDQNVTVWNPCVLPDCQPGGTGVPTKVVIEETGTQWPANSLKLSETGPAWTNILFWDKVGPTNATYFVGDFYVFPVESSYAQAYEYDIFAYNAPFRYMWGSECDTHGVWDIWDDLHVNWIHTAIACALPQNKWHHIQWFVHRINGDLSCDGMPCMYYDMLGVDNVYSSLGGIKEPASFLPSGWDNTSGIQFQLDRTGTGANETLIEYVQHVNLLELGN
jgi:hypothetical protein